MQKLKNSPFFTSKRTHFVFMILFPIFICGMTELGQMQSVSELLNFTFTRFGIMVFSTLLITAIFWFVNFLVKRAWIGGLITATLFYAFSCIEYYKYFISGAHFLFSDLAMTKNVADLTQFARLHFNPLLLLSLFLIAAYIVCLWLCDVRIERKFPIRGAISFLIGFITTVSLTVPALFAPVCTVFGIDNTYSYNAFSDEKRFENNNLITNFAVSINQQVTSKVEEPQNYSEELVNSMLDDADVEPVSESNVVKPNIIFIMSESFGDFRQLEGMNVPEGTYDKLDEIKKEAFSGQAIVPTFGGNTVRTEFELMFGLPVKSLNNATIPHSLLPANVEQDTFAQMYKRQGYHTTYLHPFSSSFYGREEVYSEYGFDRLMFIDDLTVPVQKLRDYIDDDTVYRQAEQIMAETDGPDYIHITTMQNHQPYGSDDDTEVNVYLKGIQKSCEELQDFLNRLKESKEPTIVFFMGDHFPFFSPDSNIYADLGITADNCEILYSQTYLIWNNYGLKNEGLPEKEVSAFYLPHIIYRQAGLPANEFNETILDVMEDEPVYSVAAPGENNSQLLDTLTYDRTIGMGYSDEEVAKPFSRNVEK